MTSKRKGWDDISPAYKQRLTRNGITKDAYSKGQSLSSARGHRDTPESAKYRKAAAAARVDVRNSVDGFDELSKAEQEQIARLWVQGITSPARGPINPKTGRRKPAAYQVRAQMDVLDLIAEYTGESQGSNFWKSFRAEYAASFSAAA